MTMAKHALRYVKGTVEEKYVLGNQMNHSQLKAIVTPIGQVL